MSVNTFVLGTACIVIAIVALGVFAESYIQKKLNKH